MTLLQVFNEALKQIPNKADELLKKLDATTKLNEEEKAQATAIVRQLKKKDIIEKNPLVLHYDCILPRPLTIVLSPAECGINDSDTFSEKNTGKAIEHVEKLVRYLNRISKDIQFSYGGGLDETGNKTATFMIDWAF